MLYLDGPGVTKDYVQAYSGFRLAAFEPNPKLSFAEGHMPAERILEAERLAVEWKTRRLNQSVK
jgi:TPR repeat protein